MSVNPPANHLRTLSVDDEVSFVPMEDIGEYGGLNLTKTRPLGDVRSGYTEFQDADVIVAKITPCFENGKGALVTGLVNGIAFGTTELHVLRPTACLEGRYLFYLTISSVFRQTGEAEMYGAGGQKRVPPEFNKDFRTPLPPMPEQRSIADFLDREKLKIDALIAKKQALIEKLKEKRSALISRTITRGLPPTAARAGGLNQNPPTRPSGVDWIGEIPSHWSTRRLRHISDEITVGVVVNPSSYVSDEGVPFLLGGDIREFSISVDDCNRCPSEVSEGVLRKSLLHSGDLVVVRVGYPGVAAVIPPKLEGANCASMMIVRRHLRFSSQWLAYAFNSQVGRDQIDIVQYGAAQKQFNISHAVDFIFPFPPLPEQVAISLFLDAQSAKIGQAISKLETVIERLREYRQAVITAAVTGKIDVRGLA
jgi:type I restriction enzyme S subunit